MDKPLLRSCDACGKEISRYSLFCRHCGHPQKLPLLIWLLILFLLMMMAFYLAFTIYCMSHVQDFRVVLKPCENSASRIQRPIPYPLYHAPDAESPDQLVYCAFENRLEPVRENG
jgi:hypothetical protein